MAGILIQYTYTGDEAAWEAAVDAFVSGIQNDAEVRDGFSYVVTRQGDEGKRIHMGRWQDEDVLKLMQSRDYFSAFAGFLREHSNGTLTSQRLETVAGTREL